VGMLSIWKMAGCVNTITAKDVFQAHVQGIEQGVCLKSHFIATSDILIVLVLPLSVAIDYLFIGKLKTLHHSLVRMVPII